jgi:hypothetical protein
MRTQRLFPGVKSGTPIRASILAGDVKARHDKMVGRVERSDSYRLTANSSWATNRGDTIGDSSRAGGGALQRGVGRRAGYRCRSRTGGCFGCWNMSLNGRCFGAGNRRCYGRGQESRCGSRAGGRSDTRTGCGSGCRCSAGTGCCWGSSTGGRSEGRAWGRSDCRCSDLNGCGFRRCCGSRNEGRLGGKDSPSRLGDRENPEDSEIRMQIPEVRTLGRIAT